MDFKVISVKQMLLGLLWNPGCVLQERLSQPAPADECTGQVWNNRPAAGVLLEFPYVPGTILLSESHPQGAHDFCPLLGSLCSYPVALSGMVGYGTGNRKQTLLSSTLTGTIRIRSVCFLLGLSFPGYWTTHPFLSFPVSVWVVLKVGGGWGEGAQSGRYFAILLLCLSVMTGGVTGLW